MIQERRGWWTLTIEGVEELNDVDREHIAERVKEGFTSGQVCQELEDDCEEEGDAQ